MSHSWELQKTVYAAISTPAIAGVVSVTDHENTKPSNGDYPYIEIGDAQAIPSDSSNSDGSSDTGKEEYIDIHTWSRYRGQKELKIIMGSIYDRLHLKSLSIVDRNSVLCVLDDERITDNPDGLTRHGIQTFKITHRSE